jgi:hypothetical protein
MNPNKHPRLPGRVGRILLAGMIAGSTALAAAGGASAAPKSATFTQTFTGGKAVNLNGTGTGVCDECIPDWLYGDPGAFGLGADVTAQITHVAWSADAKTKVDYNDSELRQGATLHANTVFSPDTGTVHLKGNVHVNTGVLNSPNGNPLGPWLDYSTLKVVSVPFDESIDCAMILTGDGSKSCTVTLASIPAISLPVLFPLEINLNVDFKVGVDIDGSGVATVRSLDVVGGDNLASDSLPFDGTSPSVTVADSIAIPCTAPVGSDLSYGLTSSTYTPGTTLVSKIALDVDAEIITPAPAPNIVLWDKELTSTNLTDTVLDFPLTAPDGVADLGPIAKNNIPPTADAGLDLYTGDQGSPIVFSGIGSKSVCGFPTLRWDFSDGGVAFGALPKHTFQGSGLYSGLLTATDATGLTDTTTFAIDVANAAPSANAGPDTSAAWGKPVAFNGSATDPGADDQSTLAYAWDFGDGSPSATGGPSVMHSYAQPGDYTATFTATDKHGASSADSRVVHVRARHDVATFLGSNGTFDTAGSLAASFSDEFGNPIVGRAISFTVDGNVVGTAQTGASGKATLDWTPAVDAGSHAVSATLSGDTKYDGAVASGSVIVAKKATTVAYTGALSGGPNKAVTLRASLVDATGKALAGRTIAFKVGSQTVSGQTDANGVATASLTLNQKNGNYPLTATWTPAGTDASRYVGSAAAATFSLQKR